MVLYHAITFPRSYDLHMTSQHWLEILNFLTAQLFDLIQWASPCLTLVGPADLAISRESNVLDNKVRPELLTVNIRWLMGSLFWILKFVFLPSNSRPPFNVVQFDTYSRSDIQLRSDFYLNIYLYLLCFVWRGNDV